MATRTFEQTELTKTIVESLETAIDSLNSTIELFRIEGLATNKEEAEARKYQLLLANIRQNKLDIRLTPRDY